MRKYFFQIVNSFNKFQCVWGFEAYTLHITMMKSNFISMQISMRMQQHIRNVFEKAINGKQNMRSNPDCIQICIEIFKWRAWCTRPNADVRQANVESTNSLFKYRHMLNGYCVYSNSTHTMWSKINVDDDEWIAYAHFMKMSLKSKRWMDMANCWSK